PAAPPVYATLSAAFIALFGGSYAWLALQPTISRPLLAFGVIGKTTACVLFFALWGFGQASFLLMLGGVGDLTFAALFFLWLRASAAQQGAPADGPAAAELERSAAGASTGLGTAAVLHHACASHSILLS